MAAEGILIMTTKIIKEGIVVQNIALVHQEITIQVIEVRVATMMMTINHRVLDMIDLQIAIHQVMTGLPVVIHLGILVIEDTQTIEDTQAIPHLIHPDMMIKTNKTVFKMNLEKQIGECLKNNKMPWTQNMSNS